MLRAAPQRVERAAMCPGQEQSKIVAAPPVHDGDDKTFVGLGVRQGALCRVQHTANGLPWAFGVLPCAPDTPQWGEGSPVVLGARQGAEHVARVHFGVRLLPFPPQAQPCRDPQACGYPSRA